MLGVTETDIFFALALLRHSKSKRFDESANRIGFALRLRLRLYRATGIRLFGRKTVARLLASESSYIAFRGHRRLRISDRLR
jgi:hypothetical protein